MRCVLDLVAVEIARWDKDGVVFADDFISSCAKGKETHPLRSVFVLHWGVIQAAKILEFVSDRISCIASYVCYDVTDVLVYCVECTYPKLVLQR